MKACNSCQEVKSETEFYARRNRQKGKGLHSICKPCSKAEVRKRQQTPEWKAWRVKNREENKSQIQAREKVKHAVKYGRLIRPDTCSSCQTECKPHGHHADYDKPLEVIWLCVSCHRRVHNEKS